MRELFFESNGPSTRTSRFGHFIVRPARMPRQAHQRRSYVWFFFHQSFHVFPQLCKISRLAIASCGAREWRRGALYQRRQRYQPGTSSARAEYVSLREREVHHGVVGVVYDRDDVRFRLRFELRNSPRFLRRRSPSSRQNIFAPRRERRQRQRRRREHDEDEEQFGFRSVPFFFFFFFGACLYASGDDVAQRKSDR